MLSPSGPLLDEIVARRLGEDAPVPPYSTDPAAADRLIARLEKSGILLTAERVEETWYCALTVEIGWAREKLATGSGETRETALCRAVANLPSTCRPALATPVAAAAAAATDPDDAAAASGVCLDCGAPLARAHAGSRRCPVCSYRRGRQARVDFEARRRVRKRRSPADPAG